MMTLNLGTPSHATGFPSKLLAQNGGKHIYNIKANADTDNGNIVAAGDMESLDVFTEKAATGFKGKVALQMANGNWLVLVTDPGDACLVYTEPKIPYESPSNEAYFYNAKDSVMRCYELAKGDTFEVNDAAFGSTPTVGKEITGVTGKKMTLGA